MRVVSAPLLRVLRLRVAAYTLVLTNKYPKLDPCYDRLWQVTVAPRQLHDYPLSMVSGLAHYFLVPRAS